MRKTQFQIDGFYHLYDRGVDKREIFMNDNNFIRFLTSLKEFNNESSDNQRKVEKSRRMKILNQKYETKFRMNTKLSFVGGDDMSFLKMPKFVDIICYSLNPNHYHLLVKQLMEKGVEKFMHKLNLGYTKYFNKINDRSGALLQGPFQSVAVETDEQLLYLSAYINGNIEIHGLSSAESWPWNSYQDYLGKRNGALCNKQPVISQFRDIAEYSRYTADVIKEASKRKQEIKCHLE